MDHLSAVESRIAAIRERFDVPAPARPAGGGPSFSSVLESQIAATSPTTLSGAPAASPTGTAPRNGARLVAPVDARISSGFGPRVHPLHGRVAPHAGVDFAAPSGTPIRAAAAGRVTFAGPRGGYGNMVVVDHGDGIETRYAHQRDITVRVGEQVGAGALIGHVGSTGASTGPHLHFEVRRNGTADDPLPWLGLGGGAGNEHHDHDHG